MVFVPSMVQGIQFWSGGEDNAGSIHGNKVYLLKGDLVAAPDLLGSQIFRDINLHNYADQCVGVGLSCGDELRGGSMANLRSMTEASPYDLISSPAFNFFRSISYFPRSYFGNKVEGIEGERSSISILLDSLGKYYPGPYQS
ncbi:hypothetical protein VNO77_07991 [Canavalia gladiata]|uniref:Uncharacterized protein n=1 Tax=Canavalia gladiata TaxID=3824 RepID=A0AAN9M901_CANGL